MQDEPATPSALLGEILGQSRPQDHVLIKALQRRGRRAVLPELAEQR